jgi:hypothetical protein
MIASKGIIIVAMIIMKMKLRPRKLNFAMRNR